MYQVYCDGFLLYDPNVEDLKLLSAKVNLEANTVCEGALTILGTHPHYGQLKKLKSIFEVKQDNHVLFRGRMTDDSRDFHKKLAVDLEGVLAFTNDTIIPPFILEQNTITFEGQTETFTGNVVEQFLAWIVARHNQHVEDWQKFKVGTVTVTDPNNVIARSSEGYASTWETLKSKLFESSLGGYLYVRYEEDGNYIDYVKEFEFTNTQRITLGKNMLDITTEADANATYSAVHPIGKDGLTLATLPDGNLTDDLIKKGNYIYSDSAVKEFGWICAPIDEATKDDITTVEELKDWALAYMTGTATALSNTTTITAVDLSFTDEQIQAFRVYRNVIVDTPAHGIEGVLYPLPRLEIDILNPQNTVITLGDTRMSLIDINRQQQSGNQGQIEKVQYEVQKNNAEITETVKEQTITQMTSVISQCNEIILSALESYVETSNFEAYKETVSTQLQILSDEILMHFTTVTEQVTNVDDDLQSKFTEVYKYISFADGNITLGSNENAITLTIENDMIVFKKNGLQFGWWDGVDFHTGNIVVEVNERAQFGNFAFVPRSDGSLMFLKVGG